MHQQLLPFCSSPAAYNPGRFEETPANRDILTFCDSWPAWPNNTKLLAVHGAPGCGKTHLLRRFITKLEGKGFWLTPQTIQSILTTGRELFSHYRVFILDDADQADSLTLFHLYNLIKETSGYWIISSRNPPEHWPVMLPDWRSRLRTFFAMEFQNPDAQTLRIILGKLFTDAGWLVDADTIHYIVNRMERTYTLAADTVRVLDRFAARHQRSVTIPLIRSAREQGLLKW